MCALHSMCDLGRGLGVVPSNTIQYRQWVGGWGLGTEVIQISLVLPQQKQPQTNTNRGPLHSIALSCGANIVHVI